MARLGKRISSSCLVAVSTLVLMAPCAGAGAHLEVGVDDFRVSEMEADGDPSFTGRSPAVAYNSADDEYFVVWSGKEDTGAPPSGEYEIYGQRLHAGTGALLGPALRLSDMGPDGSHLYFAGSPAVAYNPTSGEYLAAWYGDDDSGSLVDGELEIFGQRVDASTGAEIGADFRISVMGPDGDSSFHGRDPDVVYDASTTGYFAVWSGVDAVDEVEIFGRTIAASGALVGAQVRLSDMGPDGNGAHRAEKPAVAHNSSAGEHLVVWGGNDDVALLGGGTEIFGQRVDAVTGTEIGSDFRVSTMGPELDPAFTATWPDVAYNTADDEYAVVWSGVYQVFGVGAFDQEVEIFGRRLDGSTMALLGDQFRVSDMGPDGDPAYVAAIPVIAYDVVGNDYLVAWQGDDDSGALIEGEFEIFGQRVDSTGLDLGLDFRLSSMGVDGDTSREAIAAAVTFRPAAGEFVVVWAGDGSGALADDEYEIHGQRVGFQEICGTAPDPSCVATWEKSLLVVREKFAGKERLIAKLTKGPPLIAADFGNPATGTTAFDVCIFDDTGSRVARLRVGGASEQCETKPCWKALGPLGFHFRDKLLLHSGAQQMKLVGGSAAKVQIKAKNDGKNGRFNLPTGVTDALAGATSATLEIRSTDGATSCYSTTLTNVLRSEPGLFKAK